MGSSAADGSVSLTKLLLSNLRSTNMGIWFVYGYAAVHEQISRAITHVILHVHVCICHAAALL